MKFSSNIWRTSKALPKGSPDRKQLPRSCLLSVSFLVQQLLLVFFFFFFAALSLSLFLKLPLMLKIVHANAWNFFNLHPSWRKCFWLYLPLVALTVHECKSLCEQSKQTSTPFVIHTGRHKWAFPPSVAWNKISCTVRRIWEKYFIWEKNLTLLLYLYITYWIVYHL